MSLERYVILGTGIQAEAIAHWLLYKSENVFQLTVADYDPEQLAAFLCKINDARVVSHTVNARDFDSVVSLLHGHDAVVNALPYSFGVRMLEAAITAGVHYVDLGGNDDVVNKQFALHDKAVRAGTINFPATGAAPGADQPIARHGIDLYRKNTGKYPKRVAIYCGGLPQNPTGLLKYALAFSVQGLFNECLEDAEILRGGKLTRVRSLTGLETQEFPGLGELAAVYTSGGLSTMARTYEGKIPELYYKTLRYPGHWSIWNMLRELDFTSMDPLDCYGVTVYPRRVTEAVFEKVLPKNVPDMIVLRIVVEGDEGQIVIEAIIRADPETDLSAMQIATGFSAAIVAKMMVRGDVTDVGVLRQEVSLDPDLFIEEWRKSGLILDVTLPPGWEK